MKTRMAFYKVRINDPVGIAIGGYTWILNTLRATVTLNFKEFPKKMYSHVEKGIYITPELLHYMRTSITCNKTLSYLPTATGWHYFSSTTRNRAGRPNKNDSDDVKEQLKKENGTRWIKAEELFKHPDRWDVYEYDNITDDRAMVDRATSRLGKKYDWGGLAGFGGIPLLQDKEKDYCSEVCNFIVFGIWDHVISPLRLYLKLKSIRVLKLVDIH